MPKINSPPTGTLPYSDIAPRLLNSIFKALSMCSEATFGGRKLEECIPSVAEVFEWVTDSAGGINRHLKSGMKKGEVPRLCRLTMCAFKEAQNETRRSGKNVFYLPLPLRILYEALTVPSEPASDAYALAICRSMLFCRFKVHPSHPGLASSESPYKSLSTSDVEDMIQTFRSYCEKRDNIELGGQQTPELMLAHFLAMKRIFFLRFGTIRRKSLTEERTRDVVKSYCASGDIHGMHDVADGEYEFSLSHRFEGVPDPGQIVNELWGIPIPLRGAHTIFYGGLRTATNAGLVMSISGSAGTGKTSLALALAGALSPLGTRCYYMSIEEGTQELQNRLFSLIPAYLRKLSIYNSKVDRWFFSKKLHLSQAGNINKFKKDHLERIRELIDQGRSAIPVGGIPAICPLLVAIDGITGLMQPNDTVAYRDVEQFVDDCRKLGVVVLLLSAEPIPRSTHLEYLVDTVISLTYEGTASLEHKPTRILQLLKTRDQLSRPGSHVFHLSGSDGFVMVPQLASQLDATECLRLRERTPDKDAVIPTLCVYDEDREDRAVLRSLLFPYLKIFKGSSVLIHGHGSAGKVGLALKILTSPVLDVTEPRQSPSLDPTRQIPMKGRVLIVSFLYPESYYEDVHHEISRLQQKAFAEFKPSEIKCLISTPGFLKAEDLFAQIAHTLDEAILEGQAFTGILLDGLHNVFLQFPDLESNNIIWPALYNLLRRYDLTTVTTFTTFSLHLTDDSAEKEQDLLLKRHLPLLHALVQAADFYLVLEPLGETDEKPKPSSHRTYKLTVKDAIDQRIPSGHLFWDREARTLSPGEGELQLQAAKR